jgi:pentose-5-phosphate-3-epimerase
MMEARICPSILAANFATLGEESRNYPVPNLTTAPSKRHRATSGFLDIHLMAEFPEMDIEPSELRHDGNVIKTQIFRDGTHL